MANRYGHEAARTVAVENPRRVLRGEASSRWPASARQTGLLLMNLRAAVLDLFGRRPTAWLTANQVAAELELLPEERRGLESASRRPGAVGPHGARPPEVPVSRAGGTVAGEFHATRGGFGFVTPESAPLRRRPLRPRPGHPGRLRGGPRGGRREDPRAGRFARGQGGQDPEPIGASAPSWASSRGATSCPRAPACPPSPFRTGPSQDGQMASVTPGARRGSAQGAQGRSRWGDLDDPQTPIRAAEVRYGLSRGFPPEVEAEAARFGEESRPGGPGGPDGLPGPRPPSPSTRRTPRISTTPSPSAPRVTDSGSGSTSRT